MTQVSQSQASQSPPAALEVKPNPVIEGGSVTIRGNAGETVEVLEPSGKATKVKLDQNGKATIPAPGKAGQEFTVSDGKWPVPSSVDILVIEPGR